jgi:hypothetical protein
LSEHRSRLLLKSLLILELGSFQIYLNHY